jgi:DSF synthase
VYQDAQARLRYTPELLRDIGRVQAIVGEASRELGRHCDAFFRYVVWASSAPDSFNLGGDLPLLAELVERQDRAGLRDYAELCIKVVRGNAVAMTAPVIAISLVQGDALGGGMEAAFSSDIVVAETRSRFGLPEILFGLFPGMGAFNFLSVRADVLEAQRMILSGRIYTAADLHHRGFVDVLAADRQGERAVRDHIASIDRSFAAVRAVFQIRRRYTRLGEEEFRAVGELWVETALSLREGDLKKMRRISAAQIRRRAERLERDALSAKKD